MAPTLVTPGRRNPSRTTASPTPAALALRPYQREALDVMGQQRYVLPCGTATLTLAPTGNGWVVLRQERGAPVETLAAGLDLGYAQGFAEDVVRQSGAGILIGVNASWQRDMASAAQLATLHRWGLPTPAGMTKGEAQQAIATAIAARRAR